MALEQIIQKPILLALRANVKGLCSSVTILQKKFLEAQEQVKSLTQRPTDEELLELYGLFKQGTFGDNNTDKPGMFDLKGKYKWEFWNKKKGMTKEAAQEEYITFVEKLLNKYSHEKS